MAQGYDAHVIRSSGSLVVWVLGAILGVAALVDLALGDVSAFWNALAPVLLVLWLLGMVLARPAIRYDADHLVVVNPGVVHEVPWGSVVAIQRRQQLVVVTADRRIACWGGPPVPRRRPLRRVTPPDWAYAELDRARDTARAAGTESAGAPVRRVDVPALAVGAVLVVSTVVSAIL